MVLARIKYGQKRFATILVQTSGIYTASTTCIIIYLQWEGPTTKHWHTIISEKEIYTKEVPIFTGTIATSLN